MSANTSYTIKMLEARITLAKGGFNPGTGQAANTKIIRLGMCPAVAIITAIRLSSTLTQPAEQKKPSFFSARPNWPFG